MTADRDRAAAVASDPAAGKGEVEDHAHAVGAGRLLRDAHAPDEDAVARGADEAGELLDAGARQTAGVLELRPFEGLDPSPELRAPGRVGGDESLIGETGGEEHFQCAVEERNVAALGDGEPVVGEVRAEEGAARVRRHPVALHARFEVGIDEDDLRAAAPGLEQVLGGDRLVVGRVRAEEDNDVGVEPVGITAGRGGDADHLFHRRGRGRVAKARGVVDVVGAEEARGFLRHVVDLVGHAAGGDEKGEALRIGAAEARAQTGVHFVPRDAGEAALAAPAHHRVRQPAELAQRGVVEVRQAAGIGEECHVERTNRVEPEKIEACHAQVNAGDGPVVQAGDAEGAAVADAAGDNPPRVTGIVAVAPGDDEHVAEMPWLPPAQAEGQETRQPVKRAEAHAMRVARRGNRRGLVRVGLLAGEHAWRRAEDGSRKEKTESRIQEPKERRPAYLVGAEAAGCNKFNAASRSGSRPARASARVRSGGATSGVTPRPSRRLPSSPI